MRPYDFSIIRCFGGISIDPVAEGNEWQPVGAMHLSGHPIAKTIAHFHYFTHLAAFHTNIPIDRRCRGRIKHPVDAGNFKTL